MALALACLIGGGASSADEALDLAPGEPLTVSLSTGAIRRHPLILQAGDYVRIEVAPQGIEIALALLGPTASPLAQTAFRSDEPRVVRVVARESGPHVLEVRALETQPREERYVVEIKEKRPSGPSDRSRVEAQRLFNEAERLWWEGEAIASVERALQLYQSALDMWGAARDAPGQIIATRRMGRARYSMGALEEAIVAARRSLTLSHEAGDERAECAALALLSVAEVEVDLSTDAGIHGDRALSMSRRTGDRRCEAQTLNAIGDLQTLTGRNTEAPILYEQARSIAIDLHDRRGEAEAWLNLGYARANVSQIDEARTSYDAAIALWRSVGDRRGQARALIGLAQLNGIVGERQRALTGYQQARDLVDALGDRWGQAVVQSGLGATHFRLGEAGEAIPHYQSAVDLFRSARISQGEAANLVYLAACLTAVGRHEEAFKEELRALEIARSASNVRLEARVLQEIGHLHALASRLDEAFATYEKARGLAATVGDVREETDALGGMGEILHRQGRDDEARARFEEALLLAEAARDRFAESSAHLGMAQIDAARGALDSALVSVRASLARVEELRAAVASLDLRASYVASIRERHELEIDLLTQLHRRDPTRGYEGLAFEASERARARSLLDGLAEARAGIHEGVDPTLLERETSLRERLNARAGRLARMSKGDRTEPAGVVLEKEIDALTADQREIRARIRAESPRYAALVEPRPLGLAEIQGGVVDEGSVLLQYFLGERRSYVWAVTTRAVTGHVLPARAELEALVRPYREALSTPGALRGDRAGRSSALAREAELALAVSRAILGPVASSLDATRVVVVADGILESLPFAALPDPRRAGEAADLVPMAQEHEVVGLPSASTLSLIRGAWQGGRQWPKEILVLADPVFEADDPRLSFPRPPEARPVTSRRPDSPAARGARSDARRDAEGVGPQSLPRLMGSKQEASSISALWPEAEVALGFEANRTRALEPGVKDHRIVHFATHAIVDNSRPELSGIVLSLFDEHGAPREGFLRLHDVYNMSLPVDLVVLSGCSSALGKPVAGEGLISLVRGFMYAGTRRVLASLWKVDDEATSELMARFYRGMWKEGLTPAAALRQAQLQLMAQRRWSHPFYWAAFVLSGDWGPG